MIPGHCTYFSKDRGFGFLRADEGGADAYVRQSTLDRCKVGWIGVGARVEFEAAERSGKLVAEKVRVLS